MPPNAAHPFFIGTFKFRKEKVIYLKFSKQIGIANEIYDIFHC